MPTWDLSSERIYPLSGDEVKFGSKEVLGRSWGPTVGRMSLHATEGIVISELKEPAPDWGPRVLNSSTRRVDQISRLVVLHLPIFKNRPIEVPSSVHSPDIPSHLTLNTFLQSKSILLSATPADRERDLDDYKHGRHVCTPTEAVSE